MFDGFAFVTFIYCEQLKYSNYYRTYERKYLRRK